MDKIFDGRPALFDIFNILVGPTDDTERQIICQPSEQSQQTRHMFSPVQHMVIWLKTGAQNIFNRQLLVFAEKHMLVIFNIYILFFIISILDVTNYLCLGDINVL